jgi:ornithine carbamoyltransferase
MGNVKTIGSMHDVSTEDIEKYFKTATTLKDWLLKDGYRPTLLTNKVMVTVWERPSLRTRVSFEAGMAQLGGQFITLKAFPPESADIIFKEDVRDQASVLSSMCDIIMARTYKQSTIEGLVKNSTVPVINGMSDEAHPVQHLTDLYTIMEKKGDLKGLNLTYMGEGTSNTCQDLAIACASVGMNFTLGCPDYPKYDTLVKLDYGLPMKKYWNEAKARAKKSGSKLTVEHDPKKAVKGADVVYTDTPIAYDKPEEKAALNELKEYFLPYQVNMKLLKHAPNAIVMHCLPAYRGMEIDDEAMSCPQSVIYDQAENRMHVQKGILVELLKPLK